MRLDDLNWMQVEEYLGRDDRVVLPVGSTEQHAYLSLGTDSILAERVSSKRQSRSGVSSARRCRSGSRRGSPRSRAR